MDDFVAQPGVPVRQVVRQVAQALRSQSVVTSGTGFRILQESGKGTAVVAEEPESVWRGAFHVSLVSAREVTVSEGRVGGRVPWIGDVRLDGRDIGGKTSPFPPRLSLSGGPGSDGLSWIAIKVLADANGRLPSEESPDTLQIVHLTTDELRLSDPGSEASVGLLEVACLRWSPSAGRNSGRVPQSVRQVVYHDQNMIRVTVGEWSGLEFWPV